jgi:uncharacterized protein
MPEYAAGVPLWVDVSSPDLDKTRAFYTSLFGWDAQTVPDPQAGGYTMFFLDGKMVAGGGPTFSPEQHPAWTTYVNTESADATAQKVKDGGGQVLIGPMDVMGQGIMAVLQDPTGAHISIWQPQAHRGAELVNEPGSFSWNELYTRDVPTAVEFYKKIFGWGVEETQMDFGPYMVFKVEERPIAGGIDMSSIGLPESVPPHWLVYFVVKNTDDAVAKAKELGGNILAGPQPTPMGPMAVIDDPVGAAFAVIEITAQG